MASGSQQSPPPPLPAKPRPQAPPSRTTIRALSDDLFREIFLRLPSLPSLIHATLTSRAFLAAVRSSPAFRRCFRALRPPPLLGLFFDPDGPSFAPLRRRSDPDLAAAVRGADFFLTRLPAGDDASPGWEIRDCRGGYVLLVNWSIEQVAAYNPLMRSLDLLPTPPDEISDDSQGEFVYDSYHMVSSDEAPGSFRVVFLGHDKSRVRVAVFSSCSREWQILPWEEPAPAQPAEDQYWLLVGTQVNGCLYWAHANQAYLLVLDTATLQFSCIDPPVTLKGQGHIYSVGETKDGKLCIVCAMDFLLIVLHRERMLTVSTVWVLHNTFSLLEDVLQATGGSREEHGALKALGIMDGILYLSIFETFTDASLPCWFLTLCLETMKLEKLFHKKNDSHVHPYVRAWPLSLVGNNVSP